MSLLPHDRFSGESWLGMCTQLLEAIKYLHEEVSILHNDIKMNNILIAKSLNLSSSDLCDYQVVLIDFGKATKLSEGKRYHLSGVEQAEYMRKFPHIAPEVIEGETKQSTHSDIYSFGKVLFRLTNHGCLNGLHSFKQKNMLSNVHHPAISLVHLLIKDLICSRHYYIVNVRICTFNLIAVILIFKTECAARQAILCTGKNEHTPDDSNIFSETVAERP